MINIKKAVSDALEMSSHMDRNTAEIVFEMYNAYSWISSSDAHYPDDIGKRCVSFFMKEPTVEEMSLALKKIEGRTVEWK